MLLAGYLQALEQAAIPFFGLETPQDGLHLAAQLRVVLASL
jgi:hypothetical protein